MFQARIPLNRRRQSLWSLEFQAPWRTRVTVATFVLTAFNSLSAFVCLFRILVLISSPSLSTILAFPFSLLVIISAGARGPFEQATGYRGVFALAAGPSSMGLLIASVKRRIRNGGGYDLVKVIHSACRTLGATPGGWHDLRVEEVKLTHGLPRSSQVVERSKCSRSTGRGLSEYKAANDQAQSHPKLHSCILITTTMPADPNKENEEQDNGRGKALKTNGLKRPAETSGTPHATMWAPIRKQIRTDPLVGHGRHFGRTIRTFYRMHTLLTNGLSRSMQLELGRIMEEDLSPSELSEYHIYGELLKLSPGLEERLNTGSEQDLHYVADMTLGMGYSEVAYKHVFTSPSSVHGAASKATRSCNARIHGMTSVTVASLAYIATQVRFALSDSPTFSRTDQATDSEYFYNLIIDLLEDESEQVEVKDLLAWWNQQIFPAQVNNVRSVNEDSVIAKIKRASTPHQRWPLELPTRHQRGTRPSERLNEGVA
ncbi:hypothetical protein NMY22_g10591 [Coprinellus aureogranulatus]|nr:hypothetical protein NMY22_g10591 [Coprinellus aureogranulatus]